MALKVMPNELSGWDVVREDEGVALSNHPDRESALEAARIRADEERVSEEGGEPVVVDTEHVHPIDDTRQGMLPAFLSLTGLLIAVAVLVAVIALIGALTGFGS
jgi:Uncharacterized protein conserved in bacteria (DUF2188)